MTAVRLICSGGQTGADRGALDAAVALGLRCGGWCSRGRRAEDGHIPDHYPMTECDSEDYAVRTKLNVETADATIVFTFGEPTGGSKLTLDHAVQEHRPAMHVDLLAGRADLDRRTARKIRVWLESRCVGVLNVAGSRESKSPGIGSRVAGIMAMALQGEQQCVCGRAIPDSVWEADHPFVRDGKPLKCSGCGHLTYHADFEPL